MSVSESIFGALLGVLLFILHGQVTRRIFLKDYWNAKKAVNAGLFKEAETAFTKQYLRLKKQPWIDTHRAWLLLSPTRLSYRNLSYSGRIYCRGRQQKADAFQTSTLVSLLERFTAS